MDAGVFAGIIVTMIERAAAQAARWRARLAPRAAALRARAPNRLEIEAFFLRLLEPIRLDPGAALLAAPFAVALGAAAYLGLDVEPPAWPAWTVAALGAAGAFCARRMGFSRWAFRAAVLAACASSGFALADLHAAQVATPRVAERDAPYDVEGWVERIDGASPGRRRYVVRVSRLDGASVDVPKRVRMSAPAADLRLGDPIRARAVLGPPKGPPMPGAYDFARRAHFEQLGGTGYALGRPALAPDLAFSGDVARGRRLAAARGRLAARLRTAAGDGAAGGVLAALVTGDRGEIPADTTEALRAAGLGHILAISGLHLALVAGGAFFLLSWGVAAIEPLARRMNARKLAACGALAVAFAYLMISGASTPTQRAFVMAAVAFGAILANRRALTQRGVAIAALIVLALAPESAATPGFQMSFAAAVALVAANDLRRLRMRDEHHGREPGLVGAAKRFLFGLSSTSLIAGLATAPFAAYHFNRIAVLGFGANLVAMPVFTAGVMPSAALAGALVPFRLEAAPAWISGRAIEIVVAIAERAEAYPAALAPASAAPPLALACAALALVAGAILTHGRWRLVAPLALAAALMWRAEPTGDLWLGESGGWVARVEGAHGPAWVGELGRGDGYGGELFARRGGGEGAEILAPAAAPAFACDRAGCVGRVAGRTVAVAERWASVAEDCARADVVITPGRPPARLAARCAGTALVPRRGRGDHGGVVDLGAETIALETAHGATRPWRSAR